MKSKEHKWDVLLNLDKDVWGQGYKIVCKRLGRKTALELAAEHIE